MRGSLSGCCGLRTWTVSICTLYLVIHIGFLVANFIILNSPESHVDTVIKFIDTNDGRLFKSNVYRRTKQYLIQNSGEYLALPITVNVVLLISNLLGGFGALCRSAILLFPWILCYLVYIMFALALLVYMIILLPEIWFKILLFLVVAPMIVVASSFWIVVVRLFVMLRKKGKNVKTMGVPVPATVYTPEPHTWDTPLPIWALQPPTSAWDPAYLQQIDPRYIETPEPSRQSSRSRKSSSRSRSKSGDSQVSFRERQSDSMSLSEKYGGGKYESDRHTDRQQTSQDEWDTRDEDDYSDQDGRRQYLDYQSGEYSEGGGSREIEVASVDRDYTENEDDIASAHYKTPRSNRPKSRAESVMSLSDKYGAGPSERLSNFGETEEMTVNFHKGNYFD